MSNSNELATRLQNLEDENAALYAKVETLRNQKREIEKAESLSLPINSTQPDINEIKEQLSSKESENISLQRQLNSLHQQQQQLATQLEKDSLYILKELSPQVKAQKEESKQFDDQLLTLCKSLNIDTTELEKLLKSVQEKRDLVSNLREKCEQTSRLIEYQKRRVIKTPNSEESSENLQNFSNPLPCLSSRFPTRRRMNSTRHRVIFE